MSTQEQISQDNVPLKQETKPGTSVPSSSFKLKAAGKHKKKLAPSKPAPAQSAEGTTGSSNSGSTTGTAASNVATTVQN